MQVPNGQDQTDESSKPKGRGVGTAFAAAIGFTLLGFMLMGMPGMAVFYVGDMPFGGRMTPIHGDKYLEVGMWTNILWPLCIPLAQVFTMKVLSQASISQRQSKRPWN